MQIREVAARTALSLRTIRHYEDGVRYAIVSVNSVDKATATSLLPRQRAMPRVEATGLRQSIAPSRQPAANWPRAGTLNWPPTQATSCRLSCAALSWAYATSPSGDDQCPGGVLFRFR